MDPVETPAVLAVFAPFKLHVKGARESRKEEGRLCIPAAASMEMSLELPGFNNVPHSMLKVTPSLQEWVSCTCNRGAERLETQTSGDLDLQSTNTPYPMQRVTPWISQPTHHRFKCGMTQKYPQGFTRNDQVAGIEPRIFRFNIRQLCRHYFIPVGGFIVQSGYMISLF